MPASEAQIRAYQQNARLSTGSKTPEEKAVSRENSYKHGMTGTGVVKPPAEVVEVDERYRAFCDELQPEGALGQTLLKRAATLAIRMEHCSMHQIVCSDQRVAQSLADLEATEGLDPEKLARLQKETRHVAYFDPSREATLARRYETEAERGFFRALKEFRQIQKQTKAVDPARQDEIFQAELGSFLDLEKLEAEFDSRYAKYDMPGLKKTTETVFPSPANYPDSKIDIPITIGRPR